MDEIARENLAYWTEAVAIHLASPFYRTQDFRRGEIVLDRVAREGVGEVAGQRLLHLQCHFGLDTLSLARMGALVTGLDYSAPAIEAARALSAETGTPGDFVLADALDPPAGLTGFDIVFASWGAICWRRDISRWMSVAASALKPRGRLFLLEGHPAMLMMDDGAHVKAGAPFVQAFPYDSRDPVIAPDQQDYADPDAPITATRTGVWLHGLGRILNAAIAAGFVTRRLEEGDRIPWRFSAQLVPIESGYWGLPEGAPFLPLSFALEAVKGDGP